MFDALKSDRYLASTARISGRAVHISVIPQLPLNMLSLWRQINGLAVGERIDDIKIVMSSHSVDVFGGVVSKLSVVENLRETLGIETNNILCIGDQGRWPGNDFELLSTTYGLSVNEVSSSLQTCWNLTPEGHRGVQGSLFYLRCLGRVEDQPFRFHLSRARRSKT